MTDYVLVGGGPFAREVLDWFAPSLADAGSRFVGYLDDGDDPMKAYGSRLPHLGRIDDYRPQDGQLLVLGVGAPKGRQAVVERLAVVGARFATMVHPRAYVCASATLGQGVVTGPCSYVGSDAVVDDFVLQGALSGIGHDVRVGAFTTLSSYVDLTGGVSVGRTTFFGTGARVLPKLHIGEGCVIGAGAVVVRSAKDGATLYASPARVL